MTIRANFLAALILSGFAGGAAASECGQDAFSAAVADARAALERLSAEHRGSFQQKLMTIKQREGWSDEDYRANARPLVQDERIAAFDARNEELLAQVPAIGRQARSVASLAGAAPSVEPSADRRCAMLEELRAVMDGVVANARAKWAYMQGKADAALADAPAAE